MYGFLYKGDTTPFDVDGDQEIKKSIDDTILTPTNASKFVIPDYNTFEHFKGKFRDCLADIVTCLSALTTWAEVRRGAILEKSRMQTANLIHNLVPRLAHKSAAPLLESNLRRYYSCTRS